MEKTILFKGRDLKSGKIVPYIPLPSQRAFHNSKAKFRAFIAGLGNGKSQTCLVEVLKYAILYPGSVIAVIRWSHTDLRGTTWKLLKEIINDSGLDCMIVDEAESFSELKLEFCNGSTIIGLNAKNWKSKGGLKLSAFYIDEVAELPNDDVFIQFCARVDRHQIGPNRGWISGLPDGENWYWRIFFQKKEFDYEGFRGTTFDNPFQKSNYAENLVKLYGPDRAAMLIMGSFDNLEGRLFEMFSDNHILPRKRPLPLPVSCPRYAAIDPGRVKDPAAMMRVVVDQFGNIIIEDEYERFDKVTEEFCADITARNALYPPVFYILDGKSFRDTHEASVSVADTAQRCGIHPILRADNTAGYLEQAIPLIRNLLTPQDGRTHPITHERGCYPQLYVVEDCPLTIKEIRGFRMVNAGAASAYNGIRVPDHGHDLVDCLLWLALKRLEPPREEVKQNWQDHPYWKQILGTKTERQPYLESLQRRDLFD